jgi:hypothetical protein
LAEFAAVHFAAFKIFDQTSDETFHAVILPSIGMLLLPIDAKANILPGCEEAGSRSLPIPGRRLANRRRRKKVRKQARLVGSGGSAALPGNQIASRVRARIPDPAIRFCWSVIDFMIDHN